MFFIINHSLNLKIVGKYFQSEDISNYLGENPKFLNNIFFEKIDFIPITPIPILHKKAKITDLISNVNGGGSLHLVMSEKLKNIIEKYRNTGLQFFETSIIKNDVQFHNYFSLNVYEDNMNFVDFEKSNITVRIKKKGGGTELKSVKLHSLQEYIKLVECHKEKMELVTIENIFLRDIVNEDFFMLKNRVNHIVSEKLKQEIENAGCTGIEFQPIELSYQEWTAPNGEREKIYGKI